MKLASYAACCRAIWASSERFASAMIGCVSRRAQVDFFYPWHEQPVCMKCLAVSIELEMLDLTTECLVVKSNVSQALASGTQASATPCQA